MRKPDKRPPKTVREPSLDDRLEAEAVDAARQMVGPLVKELLAKYPHRPLDTLKKEDWTRICHAAIAGWIVKRSHQAKAAGLGFIGLEKMIHLESDPLDDLYRPHDENPLLG